MAWKSMVPWLGSGAAIAAGLVWAYRSLPNRGDLSRRFKVASPPPLLEEIPVTLRDSGEDDELVIEADDLDVGTAASEDARRALGVSKDEWDEIELDPADNPEPIESSDFISADALDHVAIADEPYDAVAPENVGAEWLRRATQAEPVEHHSPVEALSGTHIIDPDADDERPTNEPPEPWTPSDEEIARLVSAELHHSKR